MSVKDRFVPCKRTLMDRHNIARLQAFYIIFLRSIDLLHLAFNCRNQGVGDGSRMAVEADKIDSSRHPVQGRGADRAQIYLHKKVTWKIGTDFSSPRIDSSYTNLRTENFYSIRRQLPGKKIFFIRFATDHIPGNSHLFSASQHWEYIIRDDVHYNVKRISI